MMITVFIINNPVLSPNKDGTWTLMADWRVWIDDRYYTIPQGFTTDGASIPRFLWRVCGHPMEAPRLYLAIIHDWFYSGGCNGVTRSYADAVFRDGQICVGIRKTHAYIEWFALRLCGRSHWKKTRKETQMKKLLLIGMTFGLAIVMYGCVSEELTWGGQKAVRNPDGTVIVDATTGKPYYEKEQNHLERFAHLNDVEFKDFRVKADGETYEASVGTFGSFTGSNTVGVINASITGTTKLVAECGALYAKIAGGATADIATTVVSKMVSYFVGKGGNADKATATVDEAAQSVRISDGVTCVECDAAGNCRDCGIEN